MGKSIHQIILEIKHLSYLQKIIQKNRVFEQNCQNLRKFSLCRKLVNTGYKIAVSKNLTNQITSNEFFLHAILNSIIYER